MDLPTKEKAFLAWLENEGAYVHPGVDLFGKCPGRDGRSVIARTDIKRGEQLLLIPERLTLHLPERREKDSQSETAGKSDLVEVLDGAAEASSLSSFLLTVLLFIGEESRGADSLFSPYFETLPVEAPPSLIAWSTEQRKMLRGTSLEGDTDASLFENAFQNDLLPLMQRHLRLWPNEVQTLKAARRTAALVQSRAFHMREENWVTNQKVCEGTTLYLIPAIDMVNHTSFSREVNTELTKCKDVLTVKLKNGQQLAVDGYFTMKAEKNITVGEEILHSYGDLADAALLRIYGFVSAGQAHNPNNLVRLPYSTIHEACNAVTQKQMWPIGDFSEREAFLSTHLLCSPGTIQDIVFDLCVDNSLPETLLTIVQVLLLPGEEFHELENELTAEGSEPTHALELGFDYLDESDWSEMVLLALVEVVQSLQSKLEENKLLLVPDHEATEDTELARMVGIVVEGEQQVLATFTKDVLSLMSVEDDHSSDGESSNSQESAHREPFADVVSKKKPRHR